MPTGVYIRTQEHCDNIRKACTGLSHGKGRKFTKEHCLHLRQTRQFKKERDGYINSPEAREKMKGNTNGKGNIGKHRSKDARENYSKAAAKRLIQNKNNGKTSYGKISYFYSKKNNKTFCCLSNGEKQCLQFLESNNDILKYNTNPLRILYTYQRRKHYYVPDVLVEYNNGKQILIEVKQENGLKDKQVQAKAKAAIQYCKENNMKYQFYIEKGFIN